MAYQWLLPYTPIGPSWQHLRQFAVPLALAGLALPEILGIADIVLKYLQLV